MMFWICFGSLTLHHFLKALLSSSKIPEYTNLAGKTTLNDFLSEKKVSSTSTKLLFHSHQLQYVH